MRVRWQQWEKTKYPHYDNVIWVTSIHGETFDIEGVAQGSLRCVRWNDAEYRVEITLIDQPYQIIALTVRRSRYERVMRTYLG